MRIFSTSLCSVLRESGVERREGNRLWLPVLRTLRRDRPAVRTVPLSLVQNSVFASARGCIFASSSPSLERCKETRRHRQSRLLRLSLAFLVLLFLCCRCFLHLRCRESDCSLISFLASHPEPEAMFPVKYIYIYIPSNKLHENEVRGKAIRKNEGKSEEEMMEWR